MSVYLSPNNSLGFNRPLTTLVKRALIITNPHAQPVAFKVKTTAPKLYCVRPNSGRIEPGATAEVAVMLQPLKEEPPLNAKCKDKFLIQSTLVTPEKEQKPLGEIWTVPEGDTDEANKIHQLKLKVVYLPPEGQVLEEEDENLANQSSIIPDSRQFDTVRQQPTVNGHDIPEFALEGEPSTLQHPEEEEHHDAHEEVPVPPVSVFVQPPPPEVAVPESATPAIAPVTSTPVVPPLPDLTEELMDARAEIDRLRSLLAAAAPPAELRQRTRRLSDDITIAPSDVGTMVEELPMPQDGVPLQVVVIISLGVFIMTYLFF
ncbi:PapD-like protein [Lentinula edodes]|uniref:PapD-like protein n=1 Tax=Lentinula lateritia TaxID=40482 RepID=A0A9W9DXR1_9AGAR|nr:PapD-like protein [Lentinula edodes]